MKLLVSVRDVEECRIAWSAKVDILDIKEPRNGPLGRADEKVLNSIVRLIRSQESGDQQKLSAALGELADCEQYLPTGNAWRLMDFAKCGLAFSSGSAWEKRAADVWQAIRLSCTPVAVAYADWQECNAPHPLDVLRCAHQNDVQYLLVDTFGKGNFTSLDCLDDSIWDNLFQLIQQNEMKLVMAGGLDARHLDRLLQRDVDYVGVRGAVCRNGRSNSLDDTLLNRFQSELLAVHDQPI